MVDREELLHGGERGEVALKGWDIGDRGGQGGLRRVHTNSGGERCMV